MRFLFAVLLGFGCFMASGQVYRSLTQPDFTTDTDCSSTATINWNTTHTHKITLTGNCTMTFTNPTGATGQKLVLQVTQDATGSRLVTWDDDVYWGGGTPTTLTTTGGKHDFIGFLFNGTSYYALSVAKNF